MTNAYPLAVSEEKLNHISMRRAITLQESNLTNGVHHPMFFVFAEGTNHKDDFLLRSTSFLYHADWLGGEY